VIHATEPEPAAGTLSPAWLRSKPLLDCLLALADAERERILREWHASEGGAYDPAAGGHEADTAGLWRALAPWDALPLRLLPHPGRAERRTRMAAFADKARTVTFILPDWLGGVRIGPAGVGRGEARRWRDARSLGQGSRPRVAGEDWALWALEQQRLAWLAGETIPSGQSLWFAFYDDAHPPDYNRHQLPALRRVIEDCGIALPW